MACYLCAKANSPSLSQNSASSARIAKGAGGKGRRAKNVKNRQKVSKSFSTLFDNFRAGQKTSKIVKKRQKVFRHFSTIFARHRFTGPFWGALMLQNSASLAQNSASFSFETVLSNEYYARFLVWGSVDPRFGALGAGLHVLCLK